ncbi:G-3-P permease [Phocoenobacter uteri]|uniref:Glycerol-3-phosphate transporter n=1 Tax=Phocoenobacter uteri TaxID=146806 RepID=A0A379CC37_9PAST|nr:glycerol-3-phosphate transporter [Phocoenobacter uteri]MDG6881894.1 glycerol-3-phosphate transporter [Phocoenobacter uteri]SUB59932.1 G-3-P permease [Phocoenobacter uteri]
MIGFLKPAAHKERLPKEQLDPTYRKLRWQVFIGIFFGYAAYYFVRKNFALAMPGMIAEGWSKAELGYALSFVSIAYGISKFIMGSVSDRSDSRAFLSLGLFLSGLIMLSMGLFPWATSSVTVLSILLFLNGWVQGMGWPPCGRTMVHWWSKKERGTIVSIWNTAHNLGGAVPALLLILASSVYAHTHDIDREAVKSIMIWREALYYPGIAAIIASFITFFIMRDTPQSCGLPPIEEYKNDYPDDYNPETYEKELTAKQIFVEYVFKNKLLWYIAIANVFVYLIRYGVLDWAPTYLKEVRHFGIDKSSITYALYEIAAIPGTLFCGWVSDKVFQGKRGLTGFIFMVAVTIALYVYWQTTSQDLAMIMMVVLGFLIYGPVMLIGLHALELAPKKAAGTAAGFTGLFGYLGGSVAASAIIGWTVQNNGWDSGFHVMLAGSALACVLLFLTMIQEAKHKKAMES